MFFSLSPPLSPSYCNSEIPYFANTREFEFEFSKFHKNYTKTLMITSKFTQFIFRRYNTDTAEEKGV